MRYFKLSQVCVELGVDAPVLEALTEEGVIEIKHTTEDEPVLSARDAERLRRALVLMRDMDVNLAGVEVVLHLRDEMDAMQQQFDDVLRTLIDELRKRLAG